MFKTDIEEAGREVSLLELGQLISNIPEDCIIRLCMDERKREGSEGGKRE